MGWAHYDSDSYFWLPTTPRCLLKREPSLRDGQLLSDLRAHPDCVESGSLVNWDARIAALFDAVVFLTIPASIRMDRLRRREEMRFASCPGWSRAEFLAQHREFLAWAERYETAGTEQRSRVTHERWLARLSCPVLCLDGDLPTVERLARTLTFLERDVVSP